MNDPVLFLVSPPRELLPFSFPHVLMSNPSLMVLSGGGWMWWLSHDGAIVQLTFPVFVMALMSFLGWILFVFFGGLGLVGIPVDSVRVRCRCRGLSSTPQGRTKNSRLMDRFTFFLHEVYVGIPHVFIAIASI